MPGEYLTINENGQGEYVEKKSRFIAQAVHVETEEEAIAFLEKVRKKYYDARHNCYAWVIGDRTTASLPGPRACPSSRSLTAAAAPMS